MNKRINDALLPDSTISLDQTLLLEKYLSTLLYDIRRAHSEGWRALLLQSSKIDKWQLNILEVKQKLVKKDKEKEQTLKEMFELHKKFIKPHLFSGITKTTLHNFLYIYKQ